MGASKQREARYEQVRTDWGRELLRQYPEGIPEADLEKDAISKALWSNVGWSQDLQQSVALGLMDLTVSIETKQGRKQIPMDFAGVSEEDKLAFARRTYRDATYQWELAKKEADKIAAEQQRHAESIAKSEKELRDFTQNLSATATMAELEIEQTNLRGALQKFERDANQPGLQFAQKKLIALQSRMIKLESARDQEARWFGRAGIWLGVAGFLVGILFGGFTVYAYFYPWEPSPPPAVAQHPIQKEKAPEMPSK
jgi:hypothetical protein